MIEAFEYLDGAYALWQRYPWIVWVPALDALHFPKILHVSPG
jgi:hypothetical protein